MFRPNVFTARYDAFGECNLYFDFFSQSYRIPRIFEGILHNLGLIDYSDC